MSLYECFLQIRPFTSVQVIFRNCSLIVTRIKENAIWLLSAHHLYVTLATPLLKLGLSLVQGPLSVKRVSHLKWKKWRLHNCTYSIFKAQSV